MSEIENVIKNHHTELYFRNKVVKRKRKKKSPIPLGLLSYKDKRSIIHVGPFYRTNYRKAIIIIIIIIQKIKLKFLFQFITTEMKKNPQCEN